MCQRPQCEADPRHEGGLEGASVQGMDRHIQQQKAQQSTLASPTEDVHRAINHRPSGPGALFP